MPSISVKYEWSEGRGRNIFTVRFPFLDGEPESYGATLKEALTIAAEWITADDEAQARAALAPVKERTPDE